MFENIPHELRAYRQFCNWRFEDVDLAKPTKVPYCGLNGQYAKVNDPSTWTSYDDAVNAMKSGQYNGIGFILSENDPYTFIDMDDTKGCQKTLDRQMRIFNEVNSYAEISPSGTGLHIIVKGAVPSGRKRGSIEVYSNLRYMTMTGNVYRNTPITEQQDAVSTIWEQLGESTQSASWFLGTDPETMADREILQMAMGASNGQKFIDLYEGNWQQHYSSQSEADFALINIVAFYCKNKVQITRIFHASSLGQREKSKRVDYLNYMLNRCFDRMLPPLDFDSLQNDIQAAIENTLMQPAPVDETEKAFTHEVPEGLMGEVALFIYNSAPRPNPEVALVAALGLMAGICGRAYNISAVGLNQYLMLLGVTGCGKDQMSKGVNTLLNEVVKSVPTAKDFIGASSIASSQALTKHLSKSPSNVSIIGEVGKFFESLSGNNVSPHNKQLEKLFLDVYNKSGSGGSLGESIFADRDKNVSEVKAPAFSIAGEGEPDGFYRCLNENMISSGLLPRFTIIEYYGTRPPLNKNHHNVKPSFELVDKLAKLCAHSAMLNSQNKAQNVDYTQDALHALDAFNDYCDERMRLANNEINRHLWNRSHLKALKIAATIAVGCNPYNPCISLAQAEYAIALSTNDAMNILKRFERGDIGEDTSEAKQMDKVIDVIREYLTSPFSDIASYCGLNNRKLHSDKLVAYAFVQRRTTMSRQFKNDRLGATGALKRTLKNLCERGDIQEVDRVTLSKDYNTSSIAYVIKNPNLFI